MKKYEKRLMVCFLAFTIALALLPTATSGANSITVQDMAQGTTSADLVNKVLGDDSGLVVSNISTTGDFSAAGIFDNANLMGFETGVVISSGRVSVIPDDATDWASTELDQPGDVDLEVTTGGDTYDASVLEFDFIPEGDMLFFQYRFASDEDFLDEYDDAFALYVNDVNIALLPNDERVSVFTIRNGPYYDPGPLGTIFDYDGSSGGYSIILNATATVTPNEVNHMKFAIADLSDMEGDAAAFIAGGTFTANTAPTVNNSIPDQTAFVDQALTYAFSANTFNDSDGDDLTYTAKQSNDNPLPGWLAFTSATRTFSGTPSDNDLGTIEIKVTADDGKGGSCNDTFTLTVLSTVNDAPNITSSAPESPVNDTYCTWTKFNVSVDQTVNVTWYLDEALQHTNESTTEASYTFHADDIREHNVSALAKTQTAPICRRGSGM